MRFNNQGGAPIRVRKQAGGDLGQVVHGAPFAAGLGKNDALNRAVAAHANRAGQKRIARDLARHAAAIQLQNDFVPGDFAQIIRIRFSFLDHAQFSIGKF